MAEKFELKCSHKYKHAFTESKSTSQQTDKMSTPETNETSNIFASNPPSEEVDSVSPPKQPITASEPAEAELESEGEGWEEWVEAEVEEGYYQEDENEWQSEEPYEDSYDDYHDGGYGLDWNESGYFD